METDIGDLLRAIRDAVSTPRQKDDDIALPVFDPEKGDCGAASWCVSIEALATELQWSSIKTAAKAGKALKGSALIWFEFWEPPQGRSWENLRTDIIGAYPERKNLTEKLSKAVLYTSDSVDSYGEYVREKIRLFHNTKIAFTDQQLIELVCGGINDVDVRMASLNSGVATISALISLLSIYVKTRKRTLEHSVSAGPSGVKRSKFNADRKCFICVQVGHLHFMCPKKPTQIASRVSNQISQAQKPNELRTKLCTYCNKIGHTEALCFAKQRSESVRENSMLNKEANFLGKLN